MLYKRRWRASKRCSIRGQCANLARGAQLEQQLALEASASAQQQEVESPFFEGHSCCEIDADDVVGVGDAGGENSPSDLALMALGLEGGDVMFTPSEGIPA